MNTNRNKWLPAFDLHRFSIPKGKQNNDLSQQHSQFINNEILGN